MIRPILHYPDPRLRQAAEPVAQVDDDVRKLVDDMAETMYAAPGVGLAAPQIGEGKRIFIMDVAKEDEPSDLRVFINPEIVERHGEIAWEEGCLSFPGAREEITRAERIRVRALDRDGKTFEMVFEGLAAVAVQHENDHLDGKLMIDHLSLIRRRLLHREMSKIAASKRRETKDDVAAE
ncbi:MAG: peptide deformylase [Deltaproteobacteria bacterium]|nr:peptide deformylase [Deltaproteobacteria bacterium]